MSSLVFLRVDVSAASGIAISNVIIDVANIRVVNARTIFLSAIGTNQMCSYVIIMIMILSASDPANCIFVVP